MLSNEEKQKLVELAVQKFATEKKYKDILVWLVDEMDKIYEKTIQKRIDEEFKQFWDNIDNPPRMPIGKVIGRYKLVKIDDKGVQNEPPKCIICNKPITIHDEVYDGKCSECRK